MKTQNEMAMVEAGESMARETAKVLKGGNLMRWASEQFAAAKVAASEGNLATARKLAAAGMLASSVA